MRGSSINALQLPFNGEDEDAGAETTAGLDGFAPPLASKAASDDVTDAARPAAVQVGAVDGELLAPEEPDGSRIELLPTLLLLPSLLLPLPPLVVEEAVVVGAGAGVARQGEEIAGANRSTDKPVPP